MRVGGDPSREEQCVWVMTFDVGLGRWGRLTASQDAPILCTRTREQPWELETARALAGAACMWASTLSGSPLDVDTRWSDAHSLGSLEPA